MDKYLQCTGGKKVEIREFAEKLREYLLGELNEVREIRIENVLKNNSVTLTGLVFMEKDCKVCPTIYLEEFYSKYLLGRSITEILGDIINVYKKAYIQEDLDMSFMYSWDSVKSMVVYKLINTEKNGELLEKIPHKEVIDLSMVFYIAVQQYDGTIQINNNHCQMWGIDVEELVSAAQENTPQIYPVCITDIGDIAEEIGVEKSSEMAKSVDMYILSNRYNIGGAAAMLYPGSIKMVAEKLEDDVYILPSSTHEVIILPMSGQEADKLKEMVQEVNSTMVDEEDILGDSIYCYKRKNEELCVVA